MKRTYRIICTLILAMSLFQATARAQETYIDTTPPVIYGVRDLEAHASDWKEVLVWGVSAVDDSGVYTMNLRTLTPVTGPGTYTVAYIAEDASGNQTIEKAQLTVIEDEQDTEQEKINEIVDAVLDVIIKEDMTEEEKCGAVYDYLHGIAYTGQVFSEDWIQNAYMMLSYRSGDCTGYCGASMLLLDALGYDVIRVDNESGFTHCWCLVSTDHGKTWRHFDPTCWRWGEEGRLCLVTDDELAYYAQLHEYYYGCRTHDWNREKYPSAAEGFAES